MEKFTVVLKLDKDTRRFFRFQTEDEAEALVSNIYISKSAFDGKVPEVVKITVEES